MRKLTPFLSAAAMIALSFGCSGGACAAAEVTQLAFFEGTWKCTGTISGCSPAGSCTTAGSTHIERAVDGNWLHVVGDETVQGSPGATLHFALYLGYDAHRKTFVALGVGPGVYGTQYSKGWVNDTFVLSADRYLARDTFVRKGADEFEHTAHVQAKDKTWRKIQDEDCRRTP
jgi:Protein of unknown function (DUF1579)